MGSEVTDVTGSTTLSHGGDRTAGLRITLLTEHINNKVTQPASMIKDINVEIQLTLEKHWLPSVQRSNRSLETEHLMVRYKID